MEVRESGDGAEVFEGARGGCLGLRWEEGEILRGYWGLRGFWRDWEYTL